MSERRGPRERVRERMSSVRPLAPRISPALRRARTGGRRATHPGGRSRLTSDVLAATDGLTLTARPEDADVILFNTCSVREKAQERVFHDLGRVRALKARKPERIIGVGGCVASQEGAAIVRR